MEARHRSDAASAREGAAETHGGDEGDTSGGGTERGLPSGEEAKRGAEGESTEGGGGEKAAEVLSGGTQVVEDPGTGLDADPGRGEGQETSRLPGGGREEGSVEGRANAPTAPGGASRSDAPSGTAGGRGSSGGSGEGSGGAAAVQVPARGRPVAASMRSFEVVAGTADGKEKEYVVYVIHVSDGAQEWTVRRRFKNFEALHRVLKDYPAYRYRLPPKRFFVHTKASSTGSQGTMLDAV